MSEQNNTLGKVLLAAKIPRNLHRLVQSESTRLDRTIQDVVTYAVTLYAAGRKPSSAPVVVDFFSRESQPAAIESRMWVDILDQYLIEMPMEKVGVIVWALAFVTRLTETGVLSEALNLPAGADLSLLFNRPADSARVLLGARIPAHLHQKIKDECKRLNMPVQDLVVRILIYYFMLEPWDRDKWLRRKIDASISPDRTEQDPFLAKVRNELQECWRVSIAAMTRQTILTLVTAMEWDLQMARSARRVAKASERRKGKKEA